MLQLTQIEKQLILIIEIEAILRLVFLGYTQLGDRHASAAKEGIQWSSRLVGILLYFDSGLRREKDKVV